MSDHDPPVVRHSPVLGAKPAKGILKRPASQHQQDERASRLKWDEDNLATTEAQKDSTMKIDEPKTPYVHYNPELDGVMDMDESFSLDDSKNQGPSVMNEDEDDAEDQDEEEPEGWQDSGEDDEDDEDDEDGEGGEESSPKKIDHDKFAKMRAEHYNMKEALKLGHELADEELKSLSGPAPSPGPMPPLPSFAQQSNARLGKSPRK
ncbi:hypothetical protein B0O80DRAFT_449327 [Mortierella sp. GBAus27b]|nr:hypothetical protein BGX31_001605 [Mortierella sp. GBA43]KAI8355454.1 hypothetical protein B0O80DRAFT_449327 [Mortierella sp. GBAus27b]